MTRKNDKAIREDNGTVNIDLMSSDSESEKETTRAFNPKNQPKVNTKKTPFDPKNQLTFDYNGEPIKFKKAVISPKAEQIIIQPDVDLR